jgi:hypothetical protein
MKLLRTLPFFLSLVAAASAQTVDPGNALAVFNAFIARYSGTAMQWRTDIQLQPDPSVLVPNGFLKGHAPLGDFIYRPKLFTELTIEERRALTADPRLPGFIETLRQADAAQDHGGDSITLGPDGLAQMTAQQIREAVTSGQARDPDVIQVIDLSAEQMLSEQPIRIYIPSGK